MVCSRVTRNLSGALLTTALLWGASWTCVSGCTPKDEKSGGAGGSSSQPSTTGGAFAVGSSPDSLVEAVKTTDLSKDDVRALLPARLKELAPEAKQPRAASVMMRAYAAKNPQEGAALGCELLSLLPALPTKDPDVELVVDAALLAIANGGGANGGGANGGGAKGTCVDAVKKRFGKDRCIPAVRCTKDGGRLGIGATTDQKEPLCSAEDLSKEVAKDLARPKDEVLQDKPTYVTERLALAALRAANAVPEDMEKAHARRQYALKQADKPECGIGVPLGSPCHCDEAAIRDQVCRNDTTSISFSFCHLEVNDAKKELGPVIMSSPP